MIVIKKLLSYGGACPYQLEAITSDDKWLYIRYRHGILSYAVADNEESFMKNNCIDYEYSELIGEKNDGYANHDLIFPYLSDKIQFPENFRLESGR
jgi:hypothetical protein